MQIKMHKQVFWSQDIYTVCRRVEVSEIRVLLYLHPNLFKASVAFSCQTVELITECLELQAEHLTPEHTVKGSIVASD